MTDVDDGRWDNPDAAVQIEDDNPESLAGVEAEAPDDVPAEFGDRRVMAGVEYVATDHGDGWIHWERA